MGATWARSQSKTGKSNWVNFAKTGDPNGPGLTHWPSFSIVGERALRLGETIQPIPIPDHVQLDFFDRYNPTR